MGSQGKSIARRSLLKMAAIAPAAIYAPAVVAQQSQSRRTYVLVHGAWHGGWCWRRVADLLEAKGHKVYAPSLTGVADRSHLLSKSITLDTHILDVANLMEWEDLQNVVLCGHSYGGWPISGVAEKQEKRIRSIIYLDAFLPNNGQKVLDTNTPDRKKSVLEGIEKGELARPGPSAAAFFVNEKDQAWVNAKMTAQPIGVSTQPLVLTGARDRITKKAYVRARKYPQPDFDRWYEQCKADASWKVFDLNCGHDAMIDAPSDVAEILMSMS
jgi:pimeloyl-ACP methyl ester carboxylesterase